MQRFVVGQRMKHQENVSFRLKTLCLGQKNSEKNIYFPWKNCFFSLRSKKATIFPREIKVRLRIFLSLAYCFQPGGTYIQIFDRCNFSRKTHKQEIDLYLCTILQSMAHEKKIKLDIKQNLYFRLTLNQTKTKSKGYKELFVIICY